MTDFAALQLHRVGKLYGRTAALRAISLRLDPGETLALLGPNGSGKTTLLKIVAGAIAPSTGTGSVFGHDLARDPTSLRGEVGLLASDTYLYEDLTAAENIRFMVTMAGRKLPRVEIVRALEVVDLRRCEDDRVRTFSSGMRQRLALARLLVLRPRLLLLDEPYNSLDASGADLVDDVVRRATVEGRSVVLATHDAHRALGLAASVAVLDHGTLTFSGPVEAYRVRREQYVG